MDIPGAFASHRPACCGGCRHGSSEQPTEPPNTPDESPTPSEPEQGSKKKKLKVYMVADCPCCGANKKLTSYCLNINGMRLAIPYDHRFYQQFISAGLNPNDPSSKLKVCSTCSVNCKDVIVQSGDLLKGNFDFTIPSNPITVSLEKTVFKLPGDDGSTLVRRLSFVITFVCVFL
jgi:hypothetical protein